MVSYDQELQIHCIHKIPAFEGWYFRVIDNKISVAIIVGIAKSETKQEAFIQVFHTLSQTMEKVSYDISDFQYIDNPFTIMINKSVIKKHYVHIEDPHLSTTIDIEFGMPKHIRKTKYCPTIMGPFAYLKNMQCNHAIVNLESKAYGHMKYLDQCYSLQGKIYQEKDWGYSFPKKYLWIQSNCCIQKNAILFLSCATIPLKFICFTGVIMTLIIEDKEYIFGSYYGARIIESKKTNDYYLICIKQGKYFLELKIRQGEGYCLDAPIEGDMLRNVEESLLGEAEVQLYIHKECVENLSFRHCGFENDHFI